MTAVAFFPHWFTGTTVVVVVVFAVAFGILFGLTSGHR